ncbi:MAG: aminopeptidase [Thermodesulfovibrionales bacterium]
MLEVLRAVLTTNLALKPSERLLVFTDTISKGERPSPEEARRREALRTIASLMANMGRLLCRESVLVEYRATGSHGAEPPEEVWEAALGARTAGALRKARLMGPLLKKRASPEEAARAGRIVMRGRRAAVDAVVALANYSTSHTAFRHFLTALCGTRYASMPLFDASMLEGAMGVDWRALERRTREVAAVVDRAEAVEIKAPNGTRLAFSKSGRRAVPDTGLLTRAGSFGNLPAGEVYFAPVEGTAQGTLVLEWAPTRKLGSPVTLTVRDGLVTGVSGREPFRAELLARLGERAENANIAELGIGTNDRASRPDNILESEKILGTVHVALGDNSSFGGTVRTPFHQDFVLFQPTVTLVMRGGEERLLMKNGRFQGPLRPRPRAPRASK